MHINIARIVKLITSEIRTPEQKKEKWASFKRQNANTLKELLELTHTDLANPGELLGFDIDAERGLILLNYTGQAHNILHEIAGGWSEPLRQMRGLIYSFTGDEPTLVSRGFEKFFNSNELPENTVEALSEKYGNGVWLAREKADGHMIEYFVHEKELCASTRGKFGTFSSGQALEILNRAQFIKAHNIVSTLDHDLMTLVVELITPESKVHVDYDGETPLFLLAAYDTSGNKLDLNVLQHLVDEMPRLFSMPKSKLFTLDEMIAEVNDRSVTNSEGWVADFNGELIKFKYIDYIGQMVRSKLSYKYIMNCLRKNRLDKMFFTLPEEVRTHAYDMVADVWSKAEEAKEAGDHKVLYQMHSDLEGSTAYFQTVCRGFYRECVAV